jgi:putative aldouronate transport system permease protein
MFYMNQLLSKRIKPSDWGTVQLLIFCLPALIYMALFNYAPLWGIQIAFKKFSAAKGIWGSRWIGFDNFMRYFNSPYFIRTFTNTLYLSFVQLLVGFPAPIILALMLNQVESKRFKKVVQTVTYAPHFISVVVLAGMIILFLSPSVGIINSIIKRFGQEPIYFMTKPEMFPWIFCSLRSLAECRLGYDYLFGSHLCHRSHTL